MKTAIVYFSLDGNTEYVAKKIAQNLTGDLIKLVPAKQYPTGKVSKFFWGGKSVTFKDQPQLQPYDFNVDEYDVIILGTPIWAGTYTPPFRTFLKENDLSGKKLAFFACCSGGSADKCFKKLQAATSNGELITTLRLVDPLTKFAPTNDIKIKDFCNKLR